MKKLILPQTTTIGGCCGKVNSEILSDILDGMNNKFCFPNEVLSDFRLSEDCGIYRIDSNISVVFSVDFMASPIFDPHTFGAIAACNAMSDIYAVGATPKLCLNILAFPDDADLDVIKSIQDGGLTKIIEAGAFLLGGHTLRNHDYLYGLAVVGFQKPDKLWSVTKVESGDQIILTKPIGLGIILGSYKKQLISFDDALEAIRISTELNDKPVLALEDIDVSGATDITGFGLIGHLCNIANASNKTFRIGFRRIPILKESAYLYKVGANTGITNNNHIQYNQHALFSDKISADERLVLFDPQTNGGLLICIPKALFDNACSKLIQNNVNFYHIGSVEDKKETLVIIDP